MTETEKPALLSDQPLSVDPWQQLRNFTRARIALGRVGSSLPTREVLDFGMSHAMARDAVHTPLDAQALCADLTQRGFETLLVQSAAPDRPTYLLRPDLGRKLSKSGVAMLHSLRLGECDIAFVIGDGLSSMAVSNHAVAVMEQMRVLLPSQWRMAPVVVATQARVALSDEIGALLKARVVVMLIGERPGLSSPDSLGIYITYAPEVGRQDSERNCISNVRPEGLDYPLAARKTLWLVNESLRLKLSGVGLKDESDVTEISASVASKLTD
jgi:ethanolamine ammonia-lyase small subunit